MSFGWPGEKIQLVPLERGKHFDNCVRWLNDPQITQWLLVGDFPITRLAEKEFFDRAARENDKLVAFAIETLEEEHIGICGLSDIDFRHGTATVGLVIGREKLWNHGHGTDTIRTLTDYATRVLGLRLLLAEVFAENDPSRRVFEKCAYEQVGRIPQRWWKRGAHRDILLYATHRQPA
ncbi:MAG: GNAT family protein [Phycisphaerae bacterium]